MRTPLKLIGIAAISAAMLISCSDDDDDAPPPQTPGCYASGVLGTKLDMCASASNVTLTATHCSELSIFMSSKGYQGISFKLQGPCPANQVETCRKGSTTFYLYGSDAGYTECEDIPSYTFSSGSAGGKVCVVATAKECYTSAVYTGGSMCQEIMQGSLQNSCPSGYTTID